MKHFDNTQSQVRKEKGGHSANLGPSRRLTVVFTRDAKVLRHAPNSPALTPINHYHLLKPLQPALALKGPRQHLGALLAKLIVRQAGGDQA